MPLILVGLSFIPSRPIAEADYKTGQTPVEATGRETVQKRVTPTPTMRPTLTPQKHGKPTKGEVKAYILEVFGERAGKQAIKMLSECENSTFDQSRRNHNRNGSIDYGVFQINSIHKRKRGKKFIADWRENVKVAKQIYDEQGWSPWSCSYTIGVKPFYKK